MQRFVARVREDPVFGCVVAGNVVFAGAALYYWAQPRGGVVAALKDAAFSVAQSVPGVGGAIEAEIARQVEELEEDVLGKHDTGPTTRRLPAKGLREGVLERVRVLAAGDEKLWGSGQISGQVYHGGVELRRVMGETLSLFSLSNPLHPESFPASRKMEAEVVSMVLDLFHGEEGSCGVVTSGGTESILLAILSMREWAKEKRGVMRGNLVAPESAHAAFDKACYYFGIELRSIPVDPKTFKADVAAMARAIDGSTIGLVGSAVTFPQGVLDPIPELSELAVKHSLPLHVDSCLGSFVVALAGESGHPLPHHADFRLPGVTSISVDTHKYGFSCKGSSTLLYRTEELRKKQFFVADEWPGGIYASPTIGGSRAGAISAATWATMMYLGKDGYLESTKRILDAAKEIAKGVQDTPGIRLYGEPATSVVCFGPDTSHATPIDALKLSAAMSERGWALNALQKPFSVHIAVTHANASHAAKFIQDLRDAVQDVKKNPEKFKGGAVAIYGSKATAPPAAVRGLVHAFLGSLFKLPKDE